jgi:hypothetical protein
MNLYERIQTAADMNRAARDQYGAVAGFTALLGAILLPVFGPSALALVALALFFGWLSWDAHRLLRRLQREGGAR